MSAPETGAAVRAEAALAVDAVVTRGRSLDDALAESEQRTTAEDRALLRMLSYGTLRRHWRLREYLAALLDRPLKAKDKVVESLLAVGLFQLSESRVPDHAAVSLTVEASRRLRRPKYAPLINAVLRNFRRQSLESREPANDESRFNHPAWLIERLQRDWPGHRDQILMANDNRPPMWLRINPGKVSTREYLARLGQGKDVEDAAAPADDALHAALPQAIRLGEPRPVSELPGFDGGLVSVQDGAAQIAAPLLLANGGSRILDACAAPGGKAAHLLELAPNGSTLTALDVDVKRLGLVEATLKRLGLDSRATLLAADACETDAWWDGEPFDRILLDAPCSGTGVIRRHPDIKLLRRSDDIERAASRQRELLAALWPLLAPGGRLLYVTCSVLAAENDAVVGTFLGVYPDAVEERLLPNYNIRDLMHQKAFGFQVLPGEADLDGFYFACLDKPANTPG